MGCFGGDIEPSCWEDPEDQYCHLLESRSNVCIWEGRRE